MRRTLLVLSVAMTVLLVFGACAPAAPSPTPTATAKPAATVATAATPAGTTAAATKPAGTATAAPKPAASPTTAAAKPAPKTLEKIKYMSPTAGISFLPGFLGKSKGIFAEEGLDPEFVTLRSNLGMPALLNGEVDYAGLITEGLQAALAGEPYRLLMVQKNRASWHIILGKGINSAQDLKGKAIALDSLGGTNMYATKKALESLGVNPNDVTFLVIPAADSIAALQSGSIQAMSQTPPYSNLAVAAGFKDVLNTATVVAMATTGIGTTMKRLQDNPDQVKRLLRGFLRSLAYVRDHKDEAVQFAMKQYDMEKDIADAIVSGAIQEYAYDGTLSDQALQATLDLMKEGDGPGKNATLQMLKDRIDLGPLTQAQKELGLK